MTPPPNGEGTNKPDDDPLGGMDPMAWLESLARRQGANPDELITKADLDIPLPSAEAPSEHAAPEAPPEPAVPVAQSPQPAADDPLGGMDPMAWLESLARRQGANPDELITKADLDIPLPSAEAQVTAPGYTDFDPFSASTLSASARALEQPPAEEDTMAWLESLTAESSASAVSSAGAQALDPLEWLASLSDTSEGTRETLSADEPVVQSMSPEQALAWLDSLSAEPEPEPTLPSPARDVSSLEAGGLSDDPREVQAWLTEQLGSLLQTRAAETDLAAADVPPAEPNNALPDWLSEAIVDPTLPAARGTLDPEIKLPTPPADLPTWLLEEPEADLDLDLGEDFIPPQAPLPQVPEAALDLAPEEIERMIKPSSPEEVDDLAEYFDEEYDRRLAGDETIPLWYLEALQRAENVSITEPAPAAPPEPEVTMASAEPVAESGLPDWLRELQPEEPSQAPAIASSSSKLPEELSWLEALAEGLPEEPTVPSEPERPAIVEPAISERPEWLAPTGRLDPSVVERYEAEQAARAAEPEPQPVPEPELPMRKAELSQVLQQARQQVAQGQVLPALEHYQQLVDAMQNLEEVRADLRQLVEQHPKEPKLRRLLGDTHMRLGDLQAALDAYLTALKEL